MWEDLAVWNADFVSLFPGLSVSDLNTLEREMLTALDYVVGLKASMYENRMRRVLNFDSSSFFLDIASIISIYADSRN